MNFAPSRDAAVLYVDCTAAVFELFLQLPQEFQNAQLLSDKSNVTDWYYIGYPA